jgi:hypothetical protein
MTTHLMPCSYWVHHPHIHLLPEIPLFNPGSLFFENIIIVVLCLLYSLALFLTIYKDLLAAKIPEACKRNFMRFEVPTALNIKIALFKGMMLYSLVDKYQRFIGICCLNLQGRESKEDGSSWCLSIRLHSVTSQETIILITSSLLYLFKFYCAKF